MSEFTKHMNRLLGVGFSQTDDVTFDGLYTSSMGDSPINDLQVVKRWLLVVKDAVVVTEKEPRNNECVYLDKVIQVTMVAPTLTAKDGVLIPFIKPLETVTLKIEISSSKPGVANRSLNVMLPWRVLSHSPYSHRFQFEMAYLGLLGELVELCIYELDDTQYWASTQVIDSIPTFNKT